MLPAVKYKREEKIIPFTDGTIRIVNHTPILSTEEYEKRRREIETKLFDVFIKYTPKRRLHAECSN